MRPNLEKPVVQNINERKLFFPSNWVRLLNKVEMKESSSGF